VEEDVVVVEEKELSLINIKAQYGLTAEIEAKIMYFL
jgi:hypothetical protein